jgi:hypothetical protein
MRRLLTPLAVLAIALLSVLGGCSTVLGVDFGAATLMQDASVSTGGDASIDSASGPCVPKTCQDQSFACGTQGDGCGNAIECGGCPSQESCINGRCVCQPTTCPALGVTCGTANDGCGGALNCGACMQADFECAGGKCVCQPQTCTEQGANCGTVPDGCGDTFNCGSCVSGSSTPYCAGTPPKCGATPCMPLTTCPANACGTISNNCGGTLSCPGCTAPQTCGGGGTGGVCGCTATTCATQGKNCGSIPDVCGGMLDCGTCTAPDTCDGAGTANVCGCTPTTCAALGANCGSVSNGCGTNLDCGSCTSPDTCGGGGTADVCGCTPTVCGGRCGELSNGCGGELSCGGCDVDFLCEDNVCVYEGGGGCFPAGTPVTMADGSLKGIEDVKAGDIVKSYDPVAHRISTAVVLERRAHSVEASRDGLVLIDGSLAATTNHPFYVDGHRVRADALKPGDRVVRISERGLAVDDVVHSVRRVAGDVPTFALVVSGTKLYFAGSVLTLIKEEPP